MLNSIKWPKGYEPENVDNFVSNEVIIKGHTAKDAWEYIVNTSIWSDYYENVSNIKFDTDNFPFLEKNVDFTFNTFVFLVEAKVLEFEPPTDATPGRIAWSGFCAGEDDLYVYHAWLFENYGENAVRILTQETQKGKPAIAMANELPNPMLNAHQSWLDGISRFLSEIKK